MQQHVFSIAATCKLLGIKHVVMSPGSRSAPLVFAFAGNGNFIVHPVPDERSAAYVALGIAQQTQVPVVLFCTSGTAAANYLPAVAEAFYQRIPLVVLTADRPPELLNQQDGQMINQQHLFGNHVRAFYQLNETGINKTAKTIAEAIIKANSAVKGPVHINLPFVEPLYPAKIDGKVFAKTESAIRLWLDNKLNSKAFASPQNALSALRAAWAASPNKLILIGQSIMNEKWITPLLKLSQQNNVVILADVVSNQQQFTTAPYFDKLISAADPETLQQLQPDLLVSFGGPLLSKSLKNWLTKQKPTHHFRIQPEPEPINTYGNLTGLIHAKPEQVLNDLAETGPGEKQGTDYTSTWKNANDKLGLHISSFINKKVWSEMHATEIVLRHLPQGCNLQLANSSVVRYVSLLGVKDHSIIVNSNRGTSGIDGCTSTAVGAAKVNLRPTVLLTGDLAFLYDKNGLWLNDIPANLRIIVFNNNGGGIFTLIDGPSKYKAYRNYFTTPTPQQIKLTAQQSGLDYYFCATLSGLKKTIGQFLDPGTNKAAILELKFDMNENAKIFQQFKRIKL
ncbi:MAG: 2-succinyl-5-enolpyruvyl-6-hydroxy-3-cyclohexene-1-carboxylic-acid synthase [Bacteroidota bacterium]